jgi:hypothetical protein
MSICVRPSLSVPHITVEKMNEFARNLLGIYCCRSANMFVVGASEVGGTQKYCVVINF